MAKTAAQALAKWEAAAPTAGATWLANLQSTTKPIVSAAIAQRAAMQANFNRATAAGGVWERNLSAVGDAGVKTAAQAKQGNYATGITNGAAKMGAALTKIIAYENAGLPAIYAMPSGSTAAGIARASAWITYMAAGRGNLGA
jgi:hypothetical protein